MCVLRHGCNRRARAFALCHCMRSGQAAAAPESSSQRSSHLAHSDRTRALHLALTCCPTRIQTPPGPEEGDRRGDVCRRRDVLQRGDDRAADRQGGRHARMVRRPAPLHQIPAALRCRALPPPSLLLCSPGCVRRPPAPPSLLPSAQTLTRPFPQSCFNFKPTGCCVRRLSRSCCGPPACCLPATTPRPWWRSAPAAASRPRGAPTRCPSAAASASTRCVCPY